MPGIQCETQLQFPFKLVLKWEFTSATVSLFLTSWSLKKREVTSACQWDMKQKQQNNTKPKAQIKQPLKSVNQILLWLWAESSNICAGVLFRFLFVLHTVTTHIEESMISEISCCIIWLMWKRFTVMVIPHTCWNLYLIIKLECLGCIYSCWHACSHCLLLWASLPSDWPLASQRR